MKTGVKVGKISKKIQKKFMRNTYILISIDPMYFCFPVTKMEASGGKFNFKFKAT